MNPIRALVVVLSAVLVLSQIRPGPAAEFSTWMSVGLFRGLLLFVAAVVIAVATAATLSRVEGPRAEHG